MKLKDAVIEWEIGEFVEVVCKKEWNESTENYPVYNTDFVDLEDLLALFNDLVVLWSINPHVVHRAFYMGVPCDLGEPEPYRG